MTTHKPVSYWVIYSLFLLVIVALAGFTMRMMPLLSIPGLNYEYLLHAHSHLAFLGWVYNALFIGLVWAFIPHDKKLLSKYNTLFWITQAITVIMFIAFLIDGYQIPAIVTLAAHTSVSYFFIVYFLADSKKMAAGLSGLMMKAALLCLLLSSLGPFAIPIIKANSMNPDHIKMAVNFYLHFQYNGWFVFGILAILFKHFPENVTTSPQLKWSSALLLAGIIPSYFLSIQWMGLPSWISYTAGLAGLMQFIGALFFGLQLWRSRQDWQNLFSAGMDKWVLFGVLVFVIKYLFLILSIFPVMYEMVFHSRNIMIAYLHWHFLGFVTLLLLIIFTRSEWLSFHVRMFHIGIGIFITGFLLQEIYLFTQPVLAGLGIFLPEVHLEILLMAALLLLVGVGLILAATAKGGSE